MPKHAFVVFLVSPALPPTLLKVAVWPAACLQADHRLPYRTAPPHLITTLFLAGRQSLRPCVGEMSPEGHEPMVPLSAIAFIAWLLLVHFHPAGWDGRRQRVE